MKCIWISMLMISVLYLFVLYSYFASHAYVSANDSNLITLKSNFTSKNFIKKLYISSRYRTLQIVRGGKLLHCAESNCKLLENFITVGP